MKPYTEKKMSIESIPSDQLNYSANTNNNCINITQNTSPISSDTTKDATLPNIQNMLYTPQWPDINTLQEQIINEALAAALAQSIMPAIEVNLQGILMGYINLTLLKGYPSFNKDTNYEEEYQKAFMINEIMIKKLSQYCEEINHISERAKKLQEIFEQKLMKGNYDTDKQKEILSQLNAPDSKQKEVYSNSDSFNPKKYQKNNSYEDSIENIKKEQLSNYQQQSVAQKKAIKEDSIEEDEENSYSEMNDQNENNTQSQNQKRKNKKNRRCATQIVKKFECPYEECKKNYGSEVSLNLHIKLKHNGGNKTEREKLAKQMFIAQINGKEQPEANLNLPPGFLEQYKDGLKKVKRSRETPYSSNNLRPSSNNNIFMQTTAKSETQLKMD